MVLRILLIVLCGSAFFLTGCREVMGPVAIPDEYAVIPAEPIDEADVSARLKELQQVKAPDYQIAPQDRFNVFVYEHPELDGKDVLITPDGYLSLPLIGPVKVTGLTLHQAIEALKAKYRVYVRNPIISMSPTYIQGYNFTILGKVNRPGRYPISPGQTRVMDSIALSGGLQHGLFNGDTVDLADLDNAYILRDDKILPVNFSKVLLNRDFLHNIPLVNGDYIYIPSQMSMAVYFLGEVRNPTYVGYKEGLTFLKGLSFAHGLLDSHCRYANVIRGGLKKPKLYKIDINRIISGRSMDFLLEPNDIVYIPKSDLDDWNVIVRQIIPTLQGLSMMAGPFGNPSSFYNND